MVGKAVVGVAWVVPPFVLLFGSFRPAPGRKGSVVGGRRGSLLEQAGPGWVAGADGPRGKRGVGSPGTGSLVGGPGAAGGCRGRRPGWPASLSARPVSLFLGRKKSMVRRSFELFSGSFRSFFRAFSDNFRIRGGPGEKLPIRVRGRPPGPRSGAPGAAATLLRFTVLKSTDPVGERTSALHRAKVHRPGGRKDFCTLNGRSTGSAALPLGGKGDPNPCAGCTETAASKRKIVRISFLIFRTALAGRDYRRKD